MLKINSVLKFQIVVQQQNIVQHCLRRGLIQICFQIQYQMSAPLMRPNDLPLPTLAGVWATLHRPVSIAGKFSVQIGSTNGSNPRAAAYALTFIALGDPV